MKTEFITAGRTLIVKVRGDLDHHSEREIREEADRIFERQALNNIMFDFSDTGFMDSAGIGVIMGRYKKAVYVGGEAAVTGMNSNLDRILKVSGVYRLIKQYPSAEEGIAALEKKDVPDIAQEWSEA